MNNLRVIILTCLFGIISLTAAAQPSPDSPWDRVVPVARFGYGALQSVYWSPVNGQLAAVSAQGMQYYNADLQLQAERRFDGSQQQRVIFSPDMQRAAIEEQSGLIIRDTTTWEPVLGLNAATAPSWSPDSARLAIWSNGRLQVWDVATAAVRIELTELISDGVPVQWSPDGQVIAVPADSSIIMVNVNTGDIVRINDFARIVDFQWSRDGRWFVISGLREPLPLDYPPNYLVPNTLVKLDAVTGEIALTFAIEVAGSSDFFSSSSYLQISPDSRYVSALILRSPSLDTRTNGSWRNERMAVFDMDTGQALTHQNNPTERLVFPVDATAFSPDSTRFATSAGTTLQIFEVESGLQIADLPAYISTTRQTVYSPDGNSMVAEGGRWDITGDFPRYIGRGQEPTPEQDRYHAPYVPPCTTRNRDLCPDFLVPPPFVFDYNRPPYEWELLHWQPERELAITYEIDIEYPDTPEYDDDIPPEERYIAWDTTTGERLDQRVHLGLQTAWVYDIPDAPVVESQSRAFNFTRTTHFIGIGDDEIVDLREGEVYPLEGVNEWEWREVWFAPNGRFVYAYDTDSRFKAFEPLTGEFRYQTVPVSRSALWYTADLSLTLMQDNSGTLHIYDTESGERLLETYTANTAVNLLWNADRSRLAIGGENRAIIIYDMPAQKRLGILRGHQASISSMGWNPACDYTDMESCRYVFASSDASGQVILWGMQRRDQLVQAMPAAPAAPSFSLPAADIDFGALTPLWSYVTFTDAFGQPQAQSVRWTEAGIRINDHTYYTPELTAIGSLPDGAMWKRVADTAPDGRFVTPNGVIYTTDGLLRSSVTSSTVRDAAFDPSGERVLTAEYGSTFYPSGWVREYSAESGRFIREWGGGNPGFDLIAYSPNDRWIATTTARLGERDPQAQVHFADRFNTQFSSLIGHTDRITALYWDDEDVLTSSLDGSVRRWDIRTGWPLARWDHTSGQPVQQMDWYNTNTLLVSAGTDLYLLNANTLAERAVIPGVGGGTFDWSPDRKQVSIIGADSIVRVVDISDAVVLASEDSHMPEITHLRWHPGGESLLVARADGSVVLLDGLTGALQQSLRPRGNAVFSAAWNADGSLLLLDIVNGPIQVLDGATGEVVTEVNDPWRRSGAWWHPGGQRFAYATYPDPSFDVYNRISLLKVVSADGAELASYDLGITHYIFQGHRPFELVWSPDGRRLAAFFPNRLRVWDMVHGELLSTGPGQLPTVSLWDGDQLYYWTVNTTWRLDLTTNIHEQVSNEGLPEDTQRRADGHVWLASTAILHVDSNYSLQRINHSYIDAAWHPSCWTQDCPAVVALANGSTVTILGYAGREGSGEAAQ